MTRVPYEYDHLGVYGYKFVSMGKKKIEKVVEFIPMGIPNVLNLSFGDLLQDGSVDYSANSNNGDIFEVIATVVEIVNQFTSRRPEVTIYFTGNTIGRMRLYKRILRMYYPNFRNSFMIWGVVKLGDHPEDIPFHPEAAIEYSAFFIKRID